MSTDLDFSPTCPAPLDHEDARPRTMAALRLAMDDLKFSSIITLGTAIEQLGLLAPRVLDSLVQEDPSLLRSRSQELVLRLLLTAEDLHHALARTAGIVEVDAAQFELPAQPFNLLPLRTLRASELLYLGDVHETLVVATWHPCSEDLHTFLCVLTGRSVTLVWAKRDVIAARLDSIDPSRLLRAPEEAQRKALVSEKSFQPIFTRADLVPQAPDMQDLMAAAERDLASRGAWGASVSSESSSMVRMVKRLIMDAQALHASDIHIETNPGEEFTRIRMRRDGELELYLELSPKLRAPLVSLIKVMAKLDITEHRRPQDGKIDFGEAGGERLELRVAIIPTHDGMEDVVLRLLVSSKPVPLAQLGLQPRDVEAVGRMSAHSFGLILAAGPTGSGKTTTLHSLLAAINTDERKIWTAEDPIEITQPGLRQVQVNPKIGLTFASVMRGLLRADPDVIMVGEIRDQETAKIAIEASLTGHLVLSTLHTNNASESVVRLLELGMDALNFADALIGIVSQRLVRSLCPHCAQPAPLAPGQFEELVQEYVQGSSLTEAEGAKRLLAAAGVATPDAVRVKTAHGCERCGGKGHKGRTGIYEILENSPALRSLIQHNARATEIFEEAVRAGMRSLRHDALEKYVRGLIDMRQVRVAYQ